MKKNTQKTSSLKEQQNPKDICVQPSAHAEQVVTKSIFSEDLLKKIFFGSLIAMLLITLICGYNVGFNSDELEMNNYGKANLAYYTSGGKDTSLQHSDYRLLVYYGNGYELLASGVNKILQTDKGPNEFNVRHVINQLMAIAGLFFSGLIARKLTKSWLSASFAIWLLFLTPSFMGHFWFNTRDIPFYAGYLATLYFIICFLEELPSPTWKTSLYLMLAFSFTTNIRIGGFLLLFYFGLFAILYLMSNRELLTASLKNVVNIIVKVATVFVGGIILLIITWPFMLKKPSGLMDALGVAGKFPMKVNINFEGNAIDSLNVPVHYIPKFMLVTIPVFVIACIVTGLIIFVLNIKKYNWKIGTLLLFSTLFPVIYAIATHAAIYSSWRHFLFVFPGLCIFGALALQKIFTYQIKLLVKLAIGICCIAAMVKPISFSMRNHPYEYAYFNEIAGGFSKAFYTYDTDYWEISIKNVLDKLIVTEHLAERKDTVTIATNASVFAKYYIAHHYPKAKIICIPAGASLRNALNWHYGIFNSVFLKPDYLENYFPPPNCLFAENIDGMPVTVAMKDTARLDIIAGAELKAAHFYKADSLFSAFIKTTNDNNPGLYGLMSIAKASIQQNDVAIKLANDGLRFHLSPLVDYNCYCGLGIAYANMANYSMSLFYLKLGLNTLPKEAPARDLIKQVTALQQNLPVPHPTGK